LKRPCELDAEKQELFSPTMAEPAVTRSLSTKSTREPARLVISIGGDEALFVLDGEVEFS
jgi:hypothetical protein